MAERIEDAAYQAGQLLAALIIASILPLAIVAAL